MSEKKSKAKPCPFCGCKKSDMRDDSLYTPATAAIFWRECEGCGVAGPIGRSSSEATRAWNRRVKEEVGE